MPITEHMAAAHSSLGHHIFITTPDQSPIRSTTGYTPRQLELANTTLKMLEEEDLQSSIAQNSEGAEKATRQSNPDTTSCPQRYPRYINAIAHWESSPFGWARIALIISSTMVGAGRSDEGSIPILPVTVSHPPKVGDAHGSGFQITFGGR